MRCVCAIEGAGPRAGTGTLIAPDLVLTNCHVVESLIGDDPDFSAAECRFDYRNDDGRPVPANGAQTVFKILQVVIHSKPSPGDARGGAVFEDDKLDFAVIRIEAPAGKLDDSEGKPRGWIPVPWPKVLPAPDIGQQISILQHPYQDGGLRPLQPLKNSDAEFVDVRGGGARYIHDGATRSGSSGGPCFAKTYDFAFMAVHNASVGEPDDEKRLGQAIPLRRIAQYIERYFEQPGLLLGRTMPKDPTPDARARQRADSVERRKKAALCLMDRSSEENEFLVRLFAAASEQPAAHPLLHVVVCREDDAHLYFMDRLEHLSFEIKPDMIERSRVEALTKGLNAPTRDVLKTAWPQQNDVERRRRDLANLLVLIDSKARHLLLLSQIIDRSWSLAIEDQLLRDFAAMLAAKFADNRDGIQAVVFFIVANAREMSDGKEIVNVRDTDALTTQFSGLWSASAPPNCGVCVTLSRIGLSDLDGWRSYLEKAWAANSGFSTAIRSQFDGARLKPLEAVAKGLDDRLSKYIGETLDRSGLPGESRT
jgi:hypothetical protein